MFANGTIVEYGTHDELMAKNGDYAEMFRVQAQYYIEDKDIFGGEATEAAVSD